MELGCDQKLLFAKAFYDDYIEKGPPHCMLNASASVSWANSGAGSELAVDHKALCGFLAECIYQGKP